MKTSNEQRALIVQNCRNGATIKQISERFGVSPSTVDRILRAERAAGQVVNLARGRPQKNKWQPGTQKPTFDIRSTTLSVVRSLCEKYHAYGSTGACAVYAFAVFEDERPIAAFAWAAPPFGAAQTICPEAPQGVLALSRMVAVPREERRLRHISKPLRYQMRALIDRTRWPVLITYSDEGQGHTGHVYKCSGWKPTRRTRRSFCVDSEGHRRGVASSDHPDLNYGGKTTLQCWEHRVCAPGETAAWMVHHGWRRVEVPGRTWKSGAPTFRWVRS